MHQFFVIAVVASVIGCRNPNPARSEKSLHAPSAENIPPGVPEPAGESTTFREIWNPEQEVDIATLSTKMQFVVSQSAALCPTRELAESGSCDD